MTRTVTFSNIWRSALEVCFAFLCLRFVGTALLDSYPNVGPTAVLSVGTALLAAWQPRPALFAFTVLAAFLSGLGQASLLTVPSPPTLVFSALWLGITARELWRRRRPAVLADLPAGATCWVCLTCNLLITCLLISLAVQVWPAVRDAGFWAVFLSRPVFGFGDPSYFLSSSFLWLQGLFFFRLLVEPGAAHGVEGGAATPPSSARKAVDDPVTNWIVSVFTVWALTITLCFVFQATYHVPGKPMFFGGLPLRSSLPFEDWHSFGSITAAVFAFALVGWAKVARPWQVLIAAVIVVMVVSSWSRAAWMGAIIAPLIVLGRKLAWPTSAAVAILTFGVILGIQSVTSDQGNVAQNPIRERLGNLLRIDQPRLDLYHKALGMIQERPLVGHGIGSSYRTSVHYARAGDPLATVPDFMHNFLLQIANEQGLPVAAVYAGLLLFLLWRGFRSGSPEGTTSPDMPSGPIFGAALAFVTYLITQMTANSLNIYVSNQFFFWFLAAAMATAPKRPNG